MTTEEQLGRAVLLQEMGRMVDEGELVEMDACRRPYWLRQWFGPAALFVHPWPVRERVSTLPLDQLLQVYAACKLHIRNQGRLTAELKTEISRIAKDMQHD